MKKLFIFLIMLLLIPITTFASSVKITNIEVVSKSDNVTDNNSTYDGLVSNLKFNVSEVGDNIKYKITIKNDSGSPFNINLNTNSDADKYFDYSYTGDTKIESGKEGTIFVNAEYVKYLDVEDHKNGDYEGSINLSLTSDTVKESTNENPNTGFDYKMVLLFSIILVIGGICLYNNFNNKSIYKTFILLPLLLIPFIVDANDSETLKITVNGTVENKPFILRYYPVMPSLDESALGELDGDEEYLTITVSDSDIIEYEIPQKYNSTYGSAALTCGIAEQSVMQEILDKEPIARGDNEAFEAAYNAITTNGWIVTSYETSRAIIYDVYGYMKDIDFTFKFTLEYNKSTEETLLMDNNYLDYTSLMDYLLETNTEKITCTGSVCVDSNNETIDINNQAITPTYYVTNLNQEFIIRKRDSYTYFYSKKGYLQNGNNLEKSTFARINADGEYRSNLRISEKISSNTYKIVSIIEPEDGMFIYNKGMLYYTIYYN